MGGVLTHTVAAIVTAAIVHRLHFKWDYSWAIFTGNFLPDVIKFGFSAMKQGTIHAFAVKHDAFYDSLRGTTTSYIPWLSIAFFILGLTMLLYHFHYINRKDFFKYNQMYIFFLIGVICHLAIDIIIEEPSPWI